jgi:hypothetical protein
VTLMYLFIDVCLLSVDGSFTTAVLVCLIWNPGPSTQ